MKFLLLLFLLPLTLLAQKNKPLPENLAGIWMGFMYNDSTLKKNDFELAISESRRKLSGYTYTVYLIDGKKNIGLKKVKVNPNKDLLFIEDEKLIDNNYDVRPAKGVRTFIELHFSVNDTAEVLSGSWKTNITREYNSVTGNIFLERKKEPEQTAIIPKLRQLNLLDQLSFMQNPLTSSDDNMLTGTKRSENLMVNSAVKKATPEKNLNLSALIVPTERLPEESARVISDTSITNPEITIFMLAKNDIPAKEVVNIGKNEKVIAIKAKSPGKKKDTNAYLPIGKSSEKVKHEIVTGETVKNEVVEKENRNELTTKARGYKNVLATVNTKADMKQDTVAFLADKNKSELNKIKLLAGENLNQGKGQNAFGIVVVSKSNMISAIEEKQKTDFQGVHKKNETMLPHPQSGSNLAYKNLASAAVREVVNNEVESEKKLPEHAGMIKLKSLNFSKKEETAHLYPLSGGHNEIINKSDSLGVKIANNNLFSGSHKVHDADSTHLKRNVKSAVTNKHTSETSTAAIISKGSPGQEYLQAEIKEGSIFAGRKKTSANKSTPKTITEEMLSTREIETIHTVEIERDTLIFSLFDNGVVDGDTVSILLNGKLIMSKIGLLSRAYNDTIYLTPEMGDSIKIIMYAENLGSIAPNTGLLVVREGEFDHEIRFSGDLKKNSAIILKRKKQLNGK